MNYEVEEKRFDPQPIACVRRQARQSELSRVVPQACGDSWNLVKQHGIKAGRNVAVYLDGVMHLEIGQEVPARFQDVGELHCSSIPGGRVVTTAHWGPYDQLGNAHSAIQKWISDHELAMAGPSWEIYGHWTDDPSQLRTDIYYLLAE